MAQLLTGRGQNAAQPPAEQQVQTIGKAVEHEHPGKEEMPLAPGGQVAPARYRHPGRESRALTRGEVDERRVEVGHLPPVQPGVRVEDLQSAHQQHRQTQHGDPVRDANRPRVAVQGNPAVAQGSVRVPYRIHRRSLRRGSVARICRIGIKAHG